MLEGKIRQCLKDRNNLKVYLNSLTDAVMVCLREIDKEMQKPSTVDRGKRIATICNALEMVNDQARYFGLGIDYRTDKKKG